MCHCPNLLHIVAISINCLYPFILFRAVRLSQYALGERQYTPQTGCQSITGPAHTDRTLTFMSLDNLQSFNSPNMCCLVVGTKVKRLSLQRDSLTNLPTVEILPCAWQIEPLCISLCKFNPHLLCLHKSTVQRCLSFNLNLQSV